MKPNSVLKIVSLLACLLFSAWASADTFTINSFVDSVDADPGDAVCADDDGFCTLRAAILEANALGGPDTILAPPGIYNMTLGGADEEGGETGDMDIYDDVTIVGLGTTRIESAVGRVFHVHDGNVSITGLTLRLGDANNDQASGKQGGGVHNAVGSTLTLNNCTVTESTAQGGGGGIYNAGTLILNGSTMNTNSAPGTSKGGAIFNANTGMMTITNSTLSGNSSTGDGGAIFAENGSILDMNNVTIAGNSATAGSNGGGIFLEGSADATLSNVILAGNSAQTGPECSGTITSLGGNLIQSTSGCTVTGVSVITGNPNLGPLQDNGGRTFTRALPAGSLAVDAGEDSLCEDTDQRGLARPQGPGGCDIGAYERFPNCPAYSLNPSTTALPDGDPGVFYTQTITPTGGVAPHTFSITAGSLPDGLSLNPNTGVISGVPTTVANSSFTVTAFDANFCPASRSYTIKIGEPCLGVEITIDPTTLPAGAQGQGYSQQLTAAGGTGTYQYTITEGFLPPGLTLNLSTGLVSGTPTSTGTFFFEVTATDVNVCFGSQAYVLSIACSVDVQPTTLPNGTEGIAYSQTLTGANGTEPYTFAVISGALPPGLGLTGTGELSGTPTAPGTYTFVIEATDDNNCLGARGYTVVIDPCLVLSPDTLPGGTVGTDYSEQVTATGGTPPITFAVSGGALPSQLTLDTGTGVISGTPDTGGISLFTIGASDTSGCVTSKDYYIVVNPVGCPAIAISPTTLPDGQVGQNYNQNLTPSGGNPPYTFTFLSGEFPSGLSLSSGGNISGTPGQSGIFTFDVAATDEDGCTGTQTIMLSIFPVNCPLIVLFPTDLPEAQAGAAYSQAITATGGAPPYAYTISFGSLPADLTLDPGTGVISGTPADVGSFTFTIKATDTELCFGDESYTLDVTAGLSPTALELVSDATGVWEPAESVTIAPSWTNATPFIINSVSGDFSTTDLTITLTDNAAFYGNVPASGTASCVTSANCYSATSPGPRPGLHWDATISEDLSTGNSKSWVLHIGSSFSDATTAHTFYKFIETIFHKGITSGCSPTGYCPDNPNTRGQMAIFLLRSKLGSGYAPPAPTGIFDDVPVNDPFAGFIEDLFNRGITSGCNTNPPLYCPSNSVTRAQMAVFLLRTLLGSGYAPPAPTGIFDDVPVNDPFAGFIEDLASRGITSGCNTNPPLYCPGSANTRGQMAVFLTRTFSLTLYGP